MKTNNLFGKVTAFVAIAMVGLVVSCKDNERLSSTDASNAASESLTDSYYEDSDDISLTATDAATAPAKAETDDRLTCATVTKGTGTIDINFGTTGCTDPRGNVRVGIIHVTYSGTPGAAGFTVTTTPDGYSINGIKLEGTRTIVRQATDLANTIIHNITLTDGKATWPDASFATRNAQFTRTVNTSAVTVTLEGSASGVNRNGKSYTMDITKALVYKGSCAVTTKIYMAVEGTRLYTNTSTGKTLTIDYGSGDCDRTIAITVGRISFNYTVNK